MKNLDCEKDQITKEKTKKEPKTEDEEIWEKMPEWARLIRECCNKHDK